MDILQQRNIVSNIDRLLKKRNKKRSDLETALDISPGYISRLKKATPSSRNNLSLSLLTKISEYFNVSIDYLMLNTLDHTSDENSVIDFLESLYTESVADHLYWNCSSLEKLEYMEADTGQYGPIVIKIERCTPDDDKFLPPHILDVTERHIDDSLGYWDIAWFGYLSLGKGKQYGSITYSRTEITDDFFHARIDKIDSIIYLYRVSYFDNTKENKLPNVIEAYLVNNDQPHYLGNSLDSNSYIASKLKDLFQIAKDKSSSPRLDEETRNLLNLFNS